MILLRSKNRYVFLMKSKQSSERLHVWDIDGYSNDKYGIHV